GRAGDRDREKAKRWQNCNQEVKGAAHAPLWVVRSRIVAPRNEPAPRRRLTTRAVACACPSSYSRRVQMSDEVRRVVTGHDATGKAIVLFDGANPHKNVRPGSGTVARLLWVTDQAPADMSGKADRAAIKIGIAPPASGSIFRVVEFPPTTDEELAKLDMNYMQHQVAHEQQSSKYRPPTHPLMHRTRSIDYA